MDYDALRRRLQKEEDEATDKYAEDEEDEEEDVEEEGAHGGGMVGLDMFSLQRVAALDSPAARDSFVGQLRRVWRRHRGARLAASAKSLPGGSDEQDGEQTPQAKDKDKDKEKEREGLASREERTQHAQFLRQLVGQYRHYAATHPAPPTAATAAVVAPRSPSPSHPGKEQQTEFSLSSIISAIEEEGEDGDPKASGSGGGRQMRKRKSGADASGGVPALSLSGDGASSSSSLPSAKKAKLSPPASPVPGSLSPASPPTRTEKRLSRYRSAPSKALLERIEMAQELRFFLLFRSPLPRVPDPATAAFIPESEVVDRLLTEYFVVGPTGMVYSIKLTNLPSCNCPDNTKGHDCIHILFVLLKVLKVAPSDPILYQRALLTSELEGIYRGAPLSPAQAYARSKVPSDQASRSECWICYETLTGGKPEELVSCKDSCNYCFHVQCFHRYCSTHLSLNAHSPSPLAETGKTVACPVCFTSWVVPPTSATPNTSGMPSVLSYTPASLRPTSPTVVAATAAAAASVAGVSSSPIAVTSPPPTPIPILSATSSTSAPAVAPPAVRIDPQGPSDVEKAGAETAEQGPARTAAAEDAAPAVAVTPVIATSTAAAGSAATTPVSLPPTHPEGTSAP